MITFSKNSWHYKFNEWVGYVGLAPFNIATDRKSICTYFWSTVINLLGFVGWWVFGYLCLSGLGLLCVQGFYEVSIIDMTWLWLFGAGVLTLFILIIGGIIISFEKFSNYLRNNGNEEVDKIQSPLVEFIKAKKSKICPMIEVED